MERHAVTFRVAPGAEAAAADLLRRYDPPRLDVADGTRLLGTAVFARGTTMVRSMEIDGDLGAVARHLATDPNIQKVESSLARYLEEPYDFADPRARGQFFGRRLMTRHLHVDSPAATSVHSGRYALVLTVPPGRAEAVAEELAAHWPDPGDLAGIGVGDASLFSHSGGTVAAVVTVTGPPREALDAAGSSPALDPVLRIVSRYARPTGRRAAPARLLSSLATRRIMQRDAGQGRLIGAGVVLGGRPVPAKGK
jgi:hypothetical protein